jgi:hypothetical protein
MPDQDRSTHKESHNKEADGCQNHQSNAQHDPGYMGTVRTADAGGSHSCRVALKHAVLPGGPGRIRTYNQGIMSPLLHH